MKLLIKGGRIIDPVSDYNETADLLIENGRIISREKNISVEADDVLDAAGKIVVPGLIDIHVHFREPGNEDAENHSNRHESSCKRRLF